MRSIVIERRPSARRKFQYPPLDENVLEIISIYNMCKIFVRGNFYILYFIYLIFIFLVYNYIIQHCFICRPSDFTVSEDTTEIESRTVATRDIREGWPCWQGQTVLMYCKGPLLGWFVGSLFCLCRSIRRSKKFFFPRRSLFQFLLHHRPSSWALGSHSCWVASFLVCVSGCDFCIAFRCPLTNRLHLNHKCKLQNMQCFQSFLYLYVYSFWLKTVEPSLTAINRVNSPPPWTRP